MVRKWETYLGSFDKIVKTMGEGLLLPDKTSSTPYGLYATFVKLAKEIDFVKIVDKNFPKREQGLTIGEYFLLGILARLTKPITKSSIQGWYESKEIEKIYPVNAALLTVQNYWNNVVSLDFEKMNELHCQLLKNINRDNTIQTTYIYFDPSNFHTFIKTFSDTSTLPQNGHSKKKRFDLRQVNLALAVTKGDGIPIYHKTYPGNVNDVTFFKENLDSFVEYQRKNAPGKEIVIVFDKGNNAPVIFDKLNSYREPPVKFIGSIRPSTQEDIFNIPIEDMSESYTSDAGNDVLYKKVPVNVYKRTFRGVLTYDENTYRKKLNTWMKNMNMVMKEINTFLELKLNVKKWRKKEAVEKKLKTICSKKKMKNIVQFRVNDEDEHLSVALYCDVKAAKKKMNRWGKTLIFTSLEDKENTIDIIKGYRLKNDIEKCFKMLNNTYLLSVRPICHWNDQMIKGHMATCVLGLELIQIIRKRLRDANLKMSIEEAFERLMEISLVRLYYKNKKTVYKVGTMTKETKTLVKALGVELKV
ncbi:MAG: IS1634 family transposase [Proteobacteria bacterium]|nr:IS1634 family transposase [Pseudomonadota bacterium]